MSFYTSIPNENTQIGNLLEGNVSASSLQGDVYLLRCVCQETDQRGNVMRKLISDSKWDSAINTDKTKTVVFRNEGKV